MYISSITEQDSERRTDDELVVSLSARTSQINAPQDTPVASDPAYDTVADHLIATNPATTKEVIDVLKNVHGSDPYATTAEQMQCLAYVISKVDAMGNDAPEGLSEVLNEACISLVSMSFFLQQYTEQILFPTVENGGKSVYDEDDMLF